MGIRRGKHAAGTVVIAVLRLSRCVVFDDDPLSDAFRVNSRTLLCSEKSH